MTAARICVGLAIPLVCLAICLARETTEVEGEHEVRGIGRELVAAFAAEPQDLARLFAPGFLKELEARRLTIEDAFRSLHARHGSAREFRVLAMTGPYAAEIEFVFANGVRKPARIVLDARPPHRILGLEFRADIRSDDSFAAVSADLRKLPGKAGFSLRQLAPEAKILAEVLPEEPFAVASTMKLVVLAVLADDIAQGKRRWSDVIPLRRAWASLPAGIVQDWPDGAPITLHTLATLMMSRSDNTAADHLIRTLGRERIEQFQEDLGLRCAHRNRPFLLTAESFKLKLVLEQPEQMAYAKADQEARRQLLAGAVAAASLTRPRGLGQPQHIESIDWFYSPADLVRTLDYLRRHQLAEDILPLLAITRGLSLDEHRWPYVGFKGGAEPGVVNFALLVRRRDGRWYALAIAWNHSDGDVDRSLLVVYAQRLLQLIP